MCSVIGAVIKNPSKADFDTLRRVFLESKIRGMHATGMSFLPSWGNKVITIKEAKPADYFVETHLHNDNLESLIADDGVLYMVGHCRYSTSDLEYNQPIANDKFSVVHNGVVSQELPEHWKELYGYDCVTKNDTELLLHSLEEGKSPLEHWHDASLAVCELHNDKKIRFYRNGKRPIYFTLIENGCIITSTKDIASRAGLADSVEVPMNTYVTVDGSITFDMKTVYTDNADLQKVEYETIRI